MEFVGKFVNVLGGRNTLGRYWHMCITQFQVSTISPEEKVKVCLCSMHGYSLEQSADGPQMAGLFIRPFYTVAALGCFYLSSGNRAWCDPV